ncbi:hypothetical protein SAMN05444671_1010 [Flavobacterium sp. CF108]|uniref:hypothetical protein n=1 Tax=unclassified Flavobacterium TaxID=196869 RepID=UPI0008B6F25F|nr:MULTISPECIES: hypothetical protein [unclassified Flavobacterium]SEP35154.1 hypothetical protein SAMN04487978_0716 [Flavobacterium sp. fv08]SHG62890.1 hypothetical protein SAMN05444671_1010 [Flavobacterium sp. CF108]
MNSLKIFFPLFILSISFNSIAQNISYDPEQNITDENSRMKYDYGTKTAQLFLELFKVDDVIFKNYNKIIMIKDGKFVDNLYPKREDYNNGTSSFYLYFYNLKKENYDKIISIISKNAKKIDPKTFNTKIKQFIYLFRADFNNFQFSKIEAINNEIVMTNTDKSESFYLTFDNEGKIINGKKIIKVNHEYGSFQFGESYKYTYDKQNNITQKETLAYKDNIVKEGNLNLSITETYSKTGKLLQKDKLEYDYSNPKGRETNEIFKYDSLDNLIEKNLSFNKNKKFLTYEIKYNNNIIQVNKIPASNPVNAEIYEFKLTK